MPRACVNAIKVKEDKILCAVKSFRDLGAAMIG